MGPLHFDHGPRTYVDGIGTRQERAYRDTVPLFLNLRPVTTGRFFISAGQPSIHVMQYSDTYLRDILKRTKTVAIVGVSANQVRPSFFVARYLKLKGYRVIPVNPGLAGQTLLGEPVYADVTDIPDQVDMVDIFRRADAVPAIVDAALARWGGLQTIWMQIGVMHELAATKAATRGIDVVQDRCPKIEYQRLFGELRMGGFVTGTISSKLS